MNEAKAKQIVDFTFKDVFGIDNPFSLDEIRKKFAFDISLPKKVKDQMKSGSYTWTISKNNVKAVSTKTIMENYKPNTWIKPKKPIRSIDDIKKYWIEIAYLQGEKYIDAKEVEESDQVYESSNVFRSSKIYGSQNIIFSEDIFRSNYIVAGVTDTSSTANIRLFQSSFSSSCFEVSWSKKISKSMFITSSLDLSECLFCSNLESKKYCVANMQFTKEEYTKIKKMIIDWIIEEFDSEEEAKLTTI